MVSSLMGKLPRPFDALCATLHADLHAVLQHTRLDQIATAPLACRHFRTGQLSGRGVTFSRLKEPRLKERVGGMGDVADLTAKAYDIARMIPYGMVTSYGHIAKLAGYPNYSRHVGNAMKVLPHDSEIPWQRVISSKGLISPRGDEGQAVARQKARLEQEGVVVETLAGRGGEKVDLRVYGWFPEELPEAI